MKRYLDYPGAPVSHLIPRRSFVTGAVAAMGVGLSVPATAGQALKADRFRPPPIGAKWTYAWSDGRTESVERISNGDWGSIPVVRYRTELEGEPVLIHGFNRSLGTWVVTFDEAEEAVSSADPDDRRYRWPMTPRLYWKSKFELRDPRTDTRRVKTAAWRVDGFERVAVPDGSALTVRLLREGKRPQKVWYAWHMGLRTRVQRFRDGEMVNEKIMSSYAAG